MYAKRGTPHVKWAWRIDIKIIKCVTAELSYLEQKREWVHSMGGEREKERTSSEDSLEDKDGGVSKV